MKKIPLLFLFFLSLNCIAQFSKTHYIPPITSNSASTTLPQDHYIYISTPSVSNINFKIIQIGGTTISGTVNKNTPYIYSIGSGDATQLFVPSVSTGIVTNKGFIIESEGLIYTSIRTNVGNFAQAGGLVCKGNSALGKRFRAGAMLNSSTIVGLLNFFSILATENNTSITISNVTNGTLLANGTTYSGPITINLNKNESYILAINGNIGSNLIGALIESNKDIVVNSGSFGGTNDPANSGGRDVGFDQIVGSDKIGKEYIFIKALGTTVLERVLIIADEDYTEIYANGNTSPITTLQAGQYYVFDGNAFLNNNLYISSSKKVFAYQSIGGTNNNANQNLFFVPPLNCSTPKIVDNIPQIDKIGTKVYGGTVNIVTETGATVLINNIPATNPTTINGIPNFVFYSINGLSGDVNVKSSKQVYVSYYGTNSAATYGGYYSGFDLKPELTIENSIATVGSCISNATLKTTPDPDYTFQWLKNDLVITGAIGDTFTPTEAGYYQVKRSIPSCSTNTLSDKIPISNCPTDIDRDTVPDNIDLDNDNDGISNCTESFGNLGIDLSVANITKQTYSNTFSTNIATSSLNNSAVITPFIGRPNGDFISEVPAGKGNSLEYKINFANPISLALEYVNTANSTDLINSDGEFIIKSDIDKTVTVLNPNNQLLIDTNYDGIYESGVTEYSSFEIRFRLNSSTPLAAGTGKFSFQSYLTSSLTFIHSNLSDTNNNKATFSIKATCIPRDSDLDGTADQLDLDSDNDGITDIIESQTNTAVNSSNLDTNKDGLYDVFGSGTAPLDTDNDTVFDYLDLDSDNDGIYDKDESGTNSINQDIDNDGIKNYRELDSDNDGCFDVIEAGFLDPNGDGVLGNTSPATINTNGVVTSGTGYLNPNTNYITAAPISINTQPQINPTCELQNTSISIVDNGGNTYQWEQSSDGINWNNLSDNTTYSGVRSNTLNINRVSNSMNGYHYRVQLSKVGNSCGLLSNVATLTVYPLPSLLPTIDLKQCDDNADGRSDFNLTEKNNFISTNAVNETFTYYTSPIGAQTKDNATLIANPIAYTSNSNRIWVRVENANGCFSTSEMNLTVSSTQIPSTFKRVFKTCDDAISSISADTDGISKFDFSSVTDDVQQFLIPPLTNYAIKYYRNEADALSETNEIINTTNYRNIGYPNEQEIWIRVESILDNSCFGLGPHIKLIVNPKPNIDTNEDGHDNKLVCSNLPSFFVELNTGITDGTPTTNYSYEWKKDGVILNSETNSTLNVNSNGTYLITVSTPSGCSRTRTIQVTTSDIATINSVTIIDLTDNNSVTINASGKGIYEYSLDAPVGPFQTSNLFENVAAGIHDLYVIDTNGCGTITETVAVIGVPKFFTPNGDGFNDFWNVKGVNNIFNSKSIIYIFDRYGKLLKQILPSSQGWDGTINGEPMPTDDYWFTVKLEDDREAKGHFSLKR
jgi:gliding motility-associated-like protein